MPTLPITSLVFVSNNRRKLEEYRVLLQLPHLDMLEVPTIDPQDLNLETLTRKKIDSVRPILKNSPFFVEHTGLSIDSWKGLPGALIGQFMDTVGCDGICKMLQSYDHTDRRARAKTVIGYYHDRDLQIFDGTVFGSIAESPRPQSTTVWDWDAIFIPDRPGEPRLTFAEMGTAGKHIVSMRMKAAHDFLAYLRANFVSDDTALSQDQDDAAREDIKRLITYHQRRLQKLREQEAHYGASVEPSITMEIEDIQAKIEQLQDQLEAL